MEPLLPDTALYLLAGLMGVFGFLFSTLATAATGPNPFLFALHIISAFGILLGASTTLRYIAQLYRTPLENSQN